MNYEKLVREWVAHYGGRIGVYGDDPSVLCVDLPEGMEGEDGDTSIDVVDGRWDLAYIYLTTSVYYPATTVGPVPGGAR